MIIKRKLPEKSDFAEGTEFYMALQQNLWVKHLAHQGLCP